MSFLAFGEILLRLSPPGRELLMQTPKLDVGRGRGGERRGGARAARARRRLRQADIDAYLTGGRDVRR